MVICGIYLFHDNVSSHKARSVTSFLKEQGGYVLEHPPYNPNLAFCDVFFSSLVSRTILLAENIPPPKMLGATMFKLHRKL